eukprot:COSAG06_NODE_1320_length_9872_cov_49.877213_6_plen_47_part_00
MLLRTSTTSARGNVLSMLTFSLPDSIQLKMSVARLMMTMTMMMMTR